MKLGKVVVSGRKFKRKLQPYYKYVSPSGIIRTQLVGGMDRATVFTVEEILANDWEIEDTNATTNTVPSLPSQVETPVIPEKKIDTRLLRDLALWLEGLKRGQQGTLEPVGTWALDELWRAIKTLDNM
jgi:hypothetical protein